MVNFIFRKQPKAYQGSKTFKSATAKRQYIEELKTSIEQFHTVENVMADDLYGLVYYFYKKKTGTDADNISKPIWDCLKGILFDDDKRIKLRIAGIIDISQGNLQIIDLSNIREEVVVEIMEAFSTENLNHFVYIECGYLNQSMYRFNLE